MNRDSSTVEMKGKLTKILRNLYGKITSGNSKIINSINCQIINK